MQVSFSGKYAISQETFGISFEAIVDGSSVACKVSIEALQDIDPTNAQSSTVDQFAANRTSFERIAERKIRAGEPRPISITSADVRA